jgi:hypothetical protein
VETDLKDPELITAFKEKLRAHFPRSNLFDKTGSPVYKGVVEMELNEMN